MKQNIKEIEVIPSLFSYFIDNEKLVQKYYDLISTNTYLFGVTLYDERNYKVNNIKKATRILFSYSLCDYVIVITKTKLKIVIKDTDLFCELDITKEIKEDDFFQLSIVNNLTFLTTRTINSLVKFNQLLKG